MLDRKIATNLFVQKTIIGVNLQVEEIPEIDIIKELTFTDDDLEDEILKDTELNKFNFNF